MNIKNAVTTCVNYVKTNKWAIASKAAGAVTAGYVLFNANYSGQKDSFSYVKKAQADRITKSYMNSRRIEDRNIIVSKLKDAVFRSDVEWNLPDKINAIAGYVGGAFNQLAVDIIPAVLATGALVSSKKYSKFFGAGLAVWMAKLLVCDVMDVGRPNHLKTNEL